MATRAKKKSKKKSRKVTKKKVVQKKKVSRRPASKSKESTETKPETTQTTAESETSDDAVLPAPSALDKDTEHFNGRFPDENVQNPLIDGGFIDEGMEINEEGESNNGY